MPIIKSAIKKLRQDKKRTKHNRNIKDTIKKAILKAQEKKTAEAVNTAISLVNKAAKKHIYHKNKSARLTSNLAKLIKEKSSKKKVSIKSRTVTTKVGTGTGIEKKTVKS